MSGRGFTVAEVVIAAAILVVVFGAMAVAVARDSQTHRALSAQIEPEIRALHALERIATELRMAGEWAEDLDHDGEFDPSEDYNENGVFDSDWDLPDGAVGRDRISFNRRVDFRNEEGEVEIIGAYTRRVTYLLDGSELVREWEHEKEDGEVETRRAIVVAGVRGLRISRSGLLITVSLEMSVPTTFYAPGVRSFTTRVWLRN